MIAHPNCKINLGLRIVRRRPDGYHDLESVFLPVPLCDRLEIVPAAGGPVPVDFLQDGILVDCPPHDNICVKAYGLLKERFPQMPPVRMHLTKNIPFGAGLGGGSSDCAFVLRMLNRMFELGLSAEDLRSLAARLGADCPFFIDNVPALVTGIGDRLAPLEFNPVAGFRMLLAKPADTVGTGSAYAGLRLKADAADLPSLEMLLRQPVERWKESVVNDFEQSVFPQHPAVARLKALFYGQGALYASMSGSGAAVFALFDRQKSLPQALFDALGSQLLLDC